MVVKVKEKFEKTRQVKNIGKSEKYILRGQTIERYYDRILYNKKRKCIIFLENCFYKSSTGQHSNLLFLPFLAEIPSI